jgi:hypothetical protein
MASPRLPMDLPLRRWAVSSFQIVGPSASMSSRTISSTSAAVSGVWFVRLRFFPASGNSSVTAHVVDAVRPLPPDEVGQVRDGPGPQGLVAGVAGLPAAYRVLEVDEAQPQQLIAEERADPLVGRQPEKEP